MEVIIRGSWFHLNQVVGVSAGVFLHRNHLRAAALWAGDVNLTAGTGAFKLIT